MAATERPVAYIYLYFRTKCLRLYSVRWDLEGICYEWRDRKMFSSGSKLLWGFIDIITAIKSKGYSREKRSRIDDSQLPSTLGHE